MNTFDWIREIIGTKRVAAIPIMTHPGIEILGVPGVGCGGGR